MAEIPENDSQEVQPEATPETEQPSDVTPEVNPEVDELKKTIEEKDEQIANLSKTKRKLKKEVKEKSDENITNKSDDLDYGELAYLEAKGIKESEIDFVTAEKLKSGVELKELLSNDYFQSKLKTLRDEASIKDATPSSSRDGGEAPSTKAEFWIAKGEMPPNTPENTQIRRDIVNKRMEIAKKQDMFTSQPIVGGDGTT